MATMKILTTQKVIQRGVIEIQRACNSRYHVKLAEDVQNLILDDDGDIYKSEVELIMIDKEDGN